MLFPYKHVHHHMEKMQEFIEFIFFEVWCRAPNVEYGLHLYERNADLYKIMDEFFRLDLAEQLKDGAGRFFYESVNEIFNEFTLLSAAEIDEYARQFTDNNKIEELCAGVAEVVPATYRTLYHGRKELNAKIEHFFKELYSSGFFGLQVVRKNIGATLNDYYRSFVKENDDNVCPFCGLLPIDGEFDPTREAFDHYLPKSHYPFNSVNLRNLAPSCNKCNSGNKRDKDPIHGNGQERRNAFYPFAAGESGIEIKITIAGGQWDSLSPESVAVELTSKTHPEETDVWRQLFRIDERYVAKCCSKNGGIGWLNRVLSEHENYKLTRRAMFEAEVKTASASRWIDGNFLKKAFLEACDEADLFSDEQLGPAEEVNQNYAGDRAVGDGAA